MIVLSIIGTRPEAIKMAPVIRELARHSKRARSLTCITGQHRDLVEPVLDLFGIQADYRLKSMRPGQSLARLTSVLLARLDAVLADARPDWVLAQGDTTTVLAAGLMAHYHRVHFGHIEAGLRTGDKSQPFPEELNRRMADLAADAFFAPTERARDNLLREGHSPDRIHVTGNTAIDAVRSIAALPFPWARSRWAGLIGERRLVLVTAHRRENLGAPLRAICGAIRELAMGYGPGARFVFPLHPNPEAGGVVRKALHGLENVSLVPPLDYLTMVQLMKRASVILTDSGGIQEEAPTLGVPVVILRSVTERPEGVAAGLCRLAGTTRAGIVAATRTVLNGRRTHVGAANLYGDGRAAARIVSLLLRRRQRARSAAIQLPRAMSRFALR